MLINVNTACDLIPELLLTVASAEFPAGSALVWAFFNLDVWIVFHISGLQLQHKRTHASMHVDKVKWHHPYRQPLITSS